MTSMKDIEIKARLYREISEKVFSSCDDLLDAMILLDDELSIYDKRAPEMSTTIWKAHEILEEVYDLLAEELEEYELMIEEEWK